MEEKGYKTRLNIRKRKKEKALTRDVRHADLDSVVIDLRPRKQPIADSNRNVGQKNATV